MTKSRAAVLAALESSDSPLSAADLRPLVGDDCDLATVYRSLHWLARQGMAEEFAFACEERGVERYYVGRSRPHGHFFHCEGCHRFLPVDGCGAAEIARKLEAERGFRVESHTLYFTGRCPDCAKEREG